MELNPALRELRTPRLRLLAGHAEMAAAVADYQRRNRAHFAPWDPPTPESFLTLPAQFDRLMRERKAFSEGSGMRWWLFQPEAPQRVIGSIHFSQISRGAFHSAVLGYALDAEHQGRGLMHEALQAGLAEMFSSRVNLHRVQAAYRPENLRSAAVLRRLGFEPEGLARDYLFIAGAWRDHCIAARRNPAFRPPGDWAAADPEHGADPRG